MCIRDRRLSALKWYSAAEPSTTKPWNLCYLILTLYRLIHELVQRTDFYRGKAKTKEGEEIKKQFGQLEEVLKVADFSDKIPYFVAKLRWNAMQFSAVLGDQEFFKTSFNGFIDLYPEKEDFFRDLLNKDADTQPMMMLIPN